MKIDNNLEIRMQMENLLRGSSSAGTILKTDSGDDGEDRSPFSRLIIWWLYEEPF